MPHAPLVPAAHGIERLVTFAWYAHLRNMSHRAWYVAALASWGIALLEYLLQVPANRIGFQVLSLAQLKILQEVITLTVFVPFALLYMRQPLGWTSCGRGCACWARSTSCSGSRCTRSSTRS